MISCYRDCMPLLHNHLSVAFVLNILLQQSLLLYISSLLISTQSVETAETCYFTMLTAVICKLQIFYY